MDFQKSAKIRDHINNFTFDQCGGVFIVNFKHLLPFSSVSVVDLGQLNINYRQLYIRTLSNICDGGFLRNI